MSNLIISNQAISQHNGFYSLNDLHRASGQADKHKPTFFLRNDQTKELIAEIESENQIAYDTVVGKGKKQGTYACRELVYAYAMWISAKFHLMVIRAFDAMNTGAIPVLGQSPRAVISVEQQAQIQKAVRQKCQSNSTHYQTVYTALKDKFGVPSYKDILASDFESALAFIVGFEFAPAFNLAFVKNVLADNAHQNQKAQLAIDGIIDQIKALIDHTEELQTRLNLQDRLIGALSRQLIP